MRFFKRIIHEEVLAERVFGGFFTTANFFLIFFAAMGKCFSRADTSFKLKKKKRKGAFKSRKLLRKLPAIAFGSIHTHIGTIRAFLVTFKSS